MVFTILDPIPAFFGLSIPTKQTTLDGIDAVTFTMTVTYHHANSPDYAGAELDCDSRSQLGNAYGWVPALTDTDDNDATFGNALTRADESQGTVITWIWNARGTTTGITYHLFASGGQMSVQVIGTVEDLIEVMS